MAPKDNDILETLQYEHEMILRKFEEFKAAAGAARTKPFNQLKARLLQHIEAEELHLYPAVEALGVAEAGLVTTAEGEHDTIQTAVAAIVTATPAAATGGQVTTLENALKDHIKSERGGIFSAARNQLSSNQRTLLAQNVTTTHKASVIT
jgi:hemerythrin-like domain-containing protein